jgi:hypothetical protein
VNELITGRAGHSNYLARKGNINSDFISIDKTGFFSRRTYLNKSKREPLSKIAVEVLL